MELAVAVPPRVRFARSADSRVLAGVVGGLAARHQVDPLTARLLAVLLGLAGGLGVVAYLAAWLVSTRPEEEGRPAPISWRHTVAAASATLGILLLLRYLRLWPGDLLMIPAMMAAAGTALLASQRPELASDAIDAVVSGRAFPLRLLVGAALVLGGILSLAGAGSLDNLRPGVQSAGLTLAGVSVVLGPWLGRLVEQLNVERRERIRSEERAAVAAHLHDSVLQTLTLIQRNPDQPRRVVSLARRQERELRAWLYGDQRSLAGPESLAGALEQMAEEIEADHELRVDVVAVGDSPLDSQSRTLLGAIREAAVNAAKHSRADAIAVYLEVESGLLSAFVRDRGRGFDSDAVPPDRHGITDSIHGRLERAGGRALIVSSTGQGTEVQLYLPLGEPTKAAGR